MSCPDRLRDLLVADLAVILDLATPDEVAAALDRRRDPDRPRPPFEDDLARVPGADTRLAARLGAEVNRVLVELDAEQIADATVSRLARDTVFAALTGSLAFLGADADLDERSPCEGLRTMVPGRYGDFRRIGCGAMGLVFSAEDRELGRTVAIKLVRTGGDSGDASCVDPLSLEPPPPGDPRRLAFAVRTAHLRREAALTGELEHPGIAPIHEVGRTAHGVAYYTMRCVVGDRTLLDAIEEADRTAERLALLDPFLRVCEAIDFAHSRGVLHLDIKPGNVALGEFGQIVVLDWGLATRRAHGDGQPPIPRPIGTPGYMAPEAERLAPAPVDTWTDVYSLGASLHQILTGRLPAGHGALDRAHFAPGTPGVLIELCERLLEPDVSCRPHSVEEIVSAIRSWQREAAADAEVSAALDHATATLAAVADVPASGAIERMDAVIATLLQALELQPRNPRVQRLLDECRTRRSRVREESARTARRVLGRRVAAIVLVLVAIGATTASVLIDGQRRRAESATERAESLADFMVGDLYDELDRLGRLDVLLPTAARVLAYYDERPAADLDLGARRRKREALVRVARVLGAAGDQVASLSTYRAALAEAETIARSDAPTTDDEFEVPRVGRHVAYALARTGRLDDALASLDTCEQEFDRLLDRLEDASEIPKRRVQAAYVDRDRAFIHNRRGEFDVGDRLLASVQSVWEDFARPTDTGLLGQLAELLVRRGTAAERRGDDTAARRLFQSGLTTLGEISVPASESSLRLLVAARAHEKIAGGLTAHGEWAEAAPHLRQAEVIARHLVRRSPESVSWTALLVDVLRLRIQTLHETGDHAAADALVDEGIERARELHRISPEDVDSSDVLKNLLETAGDRAWAKRRFDAAEQYYAGSLEMRRARLATDPTNLERRCDVVLGLARLERTYDRADRLDEARELLDEAVSISSLLMTEHPESLRVRTEHAWLLLRRGSNLRRRGDTAAAAGQLERSLALHQELRRENPGLRQLRSAEAYLHAELGYTAADASRLPEAIRSLTKAARLHEKLASDPQGLVSHGFQAADVYGQLARLERERGRPRAELRWAEHAVEAVSTAESGGAADGERAKRARDGLREARLRCGAAEPGTPAEALMVALYRHRQYRCAESSDLFEVAFRGDAVVPDAEDWNFYQATQVAALASAESEGAVAEKHRDRAYAWLGRHLEPRREAIAELQRALAGTELSAQERTRLEQTLDRQQRAWEFARTGDPELAAIRGSKEFEALFRPRGRGGSDASLDR